MAQRTTFPKRIRSKVFNDAQAVKTMRTQHGIATDFCYAGGDELSLICPECGINSVRISPPEIAHGDLSSRGLVVTIRCECKNLHTFSVVFQQHKSITFVRTVVDPVARKERSSSFSTMNKLFYSIAEMYARGLLKATYPPDDTPVHYECRIYPQHDPEELLKNNNVVYIGWTISLEYVNEATNMGIHRMEFIRSTKRELIDALRDVPTVITNARQKRTFQDWLFANKPSLERFVTSDKDGGSWK
jgi:hypothetical protein